MKEVYTLSASEVKGIHQIENIAVILDADCRTGEIFDDKVDRAQVILNKLDNELMKPGNKLGSRAYIIYETQAIIYWIKKDEKEAFDFIKIAKGVKGDSCLFTVTGNELLVAAESKVAAHVSVSNHGQAGAYFLMSVMFFVLGGIITGLSYSMASPGGTYTITSGAFLIGGYYLLRAFFQLFK